MTGAGLNDQPPIGASIPIVKPEPPRSGSVSPTNFLSEPDEDGYLFRSTHQPTLTWSDPELETYKDLTSRFSPKDLDWMAEYIQLHNPGKRNLGHIASCVLNGEQWKSPRQPECRYPPNYISILLVAKRDLLLKKTVLSKLASTYNLDVINVADLIQQAVEITLHLQPEITDSKEKNTGRRKSKTMTATKRTSLTRMSRARTKSLASPVSSFASASGRISPKGDLGARVMRSLMMDGTVDSWTVVELIMAAIESRVTDFRSKTLEQAVEAANAVATAAPALKKANHDSKTPRPDSKTKDADTDASECMILFLLNQVLYLIEYYIKSCERWQITLRGSKAFWLKIR